MDLSRLLGWHDKLLSPVEAEAARKLGVSYSSCLRLCRTRGADQVRVLNAFVTVRPTRASTSRWC